MSINIFDMAEQIHREDMAGAVRATPKLKRGATVLEACRYVKEHHQATRHRGKLIDATTAGAIVAVHDALNAENAAKFAAFDDVEKMARIAWKLVAK